MKTCATYPSVMRENLIPAYDARSRLASVCDAAYTNGEWKTGLLVSNRYDHVGRRVKKITRESETTFFYDGWNLVEERIAYTNGNTSTIHYYWGKDLSGTLQGAGGVGGLLYLTVSTSNIEPQTPNSSTPNLQLYIPCYDNNGNITRYLDANGSTVAQYTYDAFGNLLDKSGLMCDTFRHRFSTKYYDAETGLYYYGYRFYCPWLMRWLTCDPIEEKGGVNLYSFCANNGICKFDNDGRAYFAYRPLNSFVFRHFVLGNDQDEKNNTMVAHEQLFFEDKGIPSNLGYFDDNRVRPDSAGILYRKPHSNGWNDCIMRKAVEMVKPRKYKLLANDSSQYNCQDWADDVRRAYYCIVYKINYYPSGTTFIGGTN